MHHMNVLTYIHGDGALLWQHTVRHMVGGFCLQGRDADTHCRQFSVIRPYLTNAQCHPDDGALEMVSEDTWRQHMNECGQIEDDFHLRKVILLLLIEHGLFACEV